MIKQCEHCGNEFTPKTERTRFCKPSCGVGFIKHKQREATRQTLVCPTCEQVFLQSRNRQKYCSPECGKRHWQITKTFEARASTHTILTCQHCLKEFTPERFYSCDRQKFCTRECQHEYHKANKRAATEENLQSTPIPARPCEYCKKKFTPVRLRDIDQKYCREQCMRDDIRDRQIEARAQLRTATIRTCPICETQFNPKKTLKEIYCSKRCARLIGRKIYRMMRSCYERTGTQKADQSHKVLGYSPNELLVHLQSFSNWGLLRQSEWHLDHVFPIIAFVRNGITDPKAICCLENLQPLPGPENCSKNDNYDQRQFDLWLETRRNS